MPSGDTAFERRLGFSNLWRTPARQGGAAQDPTDVDIQSEAEPSAEVAETEASPDRTEERAAEDPVELVLKVVLEIAAG